MPSATKIHHEWTAQRIAIDNVRLSINPLPASLLTFWLLCLLPAFIDGSVYADWVTVEKPYPVRELQTVYFDPTTIRREGDLVAIWQLTDYKWMRGGARGTPRFLSTIIHKQFDCADKRLRLLAYREFTHSMATGEASWGYVDTDMWLPVEPDSINHALWEIVCGPP